MKKYRQSCHRRLHVFVHTHRIKENRCSMKLFHFKLIRYAPFFPLDLVERNCFLFCRTSYLNYHSNMNQPFALDAILNNVCVLLFSNVFYHVFNNKNQSIPWSATVERLKFQKRTCNTFIPKE